MRLAVYGAASTAVAAGVILSAFNQRANFYSACVYLAQSNACLMVLTNLLIMLSILFGQALQRLFYGPLRPLEVESIYEKAWYAVTETCLAMTIFRDEFDVRFIIMFGILLFVKCFSWIGGGRVEFMEQQPPERPVLFHIRLASSLVLLLMACGSMLWHSVSSVLERGRPNMMVMFAFEFAILLITSMGITSRYVLSLVEKAILYREVKRRREHRALGRAAAIRRRNEEVIEVERRRAAGEDVEDVAELDDEEEEPDELDGVGWEEKGTWVFYSELTTDLLKLLTYLSFFSIVLTWYGLPLHIIRDVYLTLRSFITRIRDFIRYRRARAQLTRYPDASAEEIQRENVCIICREEMTVWAAGEEAHDQRHRPKRLPCGHVLHLACLKSWFERQPRCPTCRRLVFDDANQNANNPNAPNGAQPNAGGGLGFQAQFGIGPFGIDVGVGGPGFMQNFVDRMNQQMAQPGQQQPGQQQQQQPQQQQQQPQAGGIGIQQPHVPLGQQQPQQAQGQPGQTPTPASAIAAEIQQHIQRTRQLIERETAMLQVTQRQLQQLHDLQAQAQVAADNRNTLGATTTASGTIDNAEGQAQASSQTPQAPPTPNTALNNISGLPQGMTLPPGWSVIPLTVAGSVTPATPTTTANLVALPGRVALRSANALANRRGHRTYQESLRDYHAVRTPSTERTQEEVELGRPSVGRTTSAPAGPSPVTRERSRGASRLSPEQLLRLPPTMQDAVATISSFLQQHVSSGRLEHVRSILAGLPADIRREVQSGWPDRRQVEELSESLPESTGSSRIAANAVAGMIRDIQWEQRIRVLLGLPSEFRERVLQVVPDSTRLRTDIARVEGTLDNRSTQASTATTTSSHTHSTPNSSSTESTQDAAELINLRVALNEATRAVRDAAGALERSASASTTPSATPTMNNFNTENPLSLFGERSIFAQNSQERALRDLEQDVVNREREWRFRQVIERMLATANGTQEVTVEGAAADDLLRGFGVDRDMIRRVIEQEQQRENSQQAPAQQPAPTESATNVTNGTNTTKQPTVETAEDEVAEPSASESTEQASSSPTAQDKGKGVDRGSN